MENSSKPMSPQAFLDELKSIKLEIHPSEMSESTKTDMLKTLTEMELLVKSLKQRLQKEEPSKASANV